MKILALHSDYVEFEVTKKALKAAEEAKKEKKRIEECLVVFTSVEKNDEGSEKEAAKMLADEAKKIADQVKTKTIVLYPYAHLSSNLSKPDTAVKVLVEAEKLLKKQKFKVSRSPFGWYKSFEIKCKGHPLAELSREILVEGKDDKEKVHSKDHNFIFDNKTLSKEEKVKLTTSFLIGKAAKEIFPDIEIGSLGFYQDNSYIDISGVSLRIDEINRLNKKIKEMLKKEIKVEKAKDSELKGRFQKEIKKDLGKNSKVYKLKDITLIPTYKDPFVLSTKEIQAFKITNSSSAYWKNNANNTQLIRIYSVGFSSKKELEEYNKKHEEAEKRDHREIGKQLELFSIHEEAPGMPFFHDNGTFIFDKLIEFMSYEMKKLNYEINKTPVILNQKLWLQSGHWDHYKENMYFTKVDSQNYALKPMNCPGNILIFKNKLHSYKKLPIKAGEFGLVHRHELSGVLSGLFRVRVFTQDDAHVFCSKEQIEDQIIELIELVDKIYSSFGFTYTIELSTKPEKAMGDPKMWTLAEKSLANALKRIKKEYKINPGDGAFYGPKIDFNVKDALNRSWQCGTIQLDFSMPEKFDLHYEGKDNKKERPVMIHRAIYGSLERFIGILIEHFAGKFPLWISPNQVQIVTVTDRNVKFAKEIFESLKEKGIRTFLDTRSETIGKKIRDAQSKKSNYIITIGDKEVEKKTLAIRSRDGKVEFDVKLDDFIKSLLEEVEKKNIN